MNIIKKNLLIILVTFLFGCSQNLSTKGNFIFPNNIEKLKPGLSKQEVNDTFGPSTIRASFNENTWYYIYEVSEKPIRFLNKRIIDAKVIIINFDNNNLINDVKILDHTDRRDIPVNIKKTQNSLIKTNRNDLQDIDSFQINP